MSSARKVAAKGRAARARHGREPDHVCSGIPTTGLPATATTAGSAAFKSCGHNLPGSASTCGPPGDGKPLDLTQLSAEQRSKLESFLKSSGFGPLPKAGQSLDAATMRKLAQHMRAAAALPSKTTLRNWADTEKNPKDGLVRQAVTSSKRDDVKNLLEEGGDVDEVEPKTLCTPLMLAVRDGSKEIVQILLDYDADVTRRDKDGRTAIMEACAAGRDDLVQLLIDHGSCVADTDNSNWNSLTHAAGAGHIRCAHVVMRHLKYDKESQEKLKELTKKEETKKKKDKNKIPAASAAASATAAVASDPDLDDYDDADCPAESALAISAQRGQYEFVKWYLSHKDQFKVPDSEIQAACSKACYSKRLDLLRLLIEEHGAKVNPDGPVSELPLCAASACGDLEMVRYLLQRGARVNDTDGGGFSPLMRACNDGHSSVVPVLLQHGASVNAQNSQHENLTPLCYAIMKSNMDIVKTLVSAQANVNLGGTSPLLLAVSLNNMDIVEYLLAHGSNPTQKSQHGDAAINFAADVGNFEWVKRFHQLGCDVDTVGDKGQTPLMKAAKKGSLEIVEYLLDHGVSINRTSSLNDCTALSLACSKGWIKIIEFLLERGANRHAKLKDGVTPLLEAVKSGNAEAADLVLYYQPKNAEFREVSGGQRGGHAGCDHAGNGIDMGTYVKTAMTPRKEFYMNMNYSCKHCDAHHGDAARTASENSSDDDDERDEDDGEDGDDGEDSEDHIGCEDDEDEDDQDECQSGDEEEELEEDVDYTSDDESGDDEKKNAENFDLPEIYPEDLAKLGFSPTEGYDIKEGLDADIDFIRTQLAHFQPQSFEFRILNAMLHKAEQLQVRRRMPVVTFDLMLTNLLQKSLPNHTPEELRRRFSEEISRWQHELQSNANVDDLMDKLVTEPSDESSLENDEPGLADIAAFLQANPTILSDYPSLLMQRSDAFVSMDNASAGEGGGDASTSGKEGKPGLTLSPDGKYIIMTNSTSNFAAPLGEFEFLRSIAAAADANSSGLANGMEHLPEELAKVMADARRNGVFNMESFSTFFQGAKDDPQLLEDYRNAVRVPPSFNFSSNTPPASLTPVARGAEGGGSTSGTTEKIIMRKVPAKNAATGDSAKLEMSVEIRRPAKHPRTPEPTPDDTSEEGFEGSDEAAPVAMPTSAFKPEGRSAKKTVRSTRDVATSVTNTVPPPKKPALVDVDQQQESDSSTALIHAAIRGNAKMIATLCDAGAKPNHKDKKGWTALGYAVERGHKDAVKELCEHGAELDCVMDTNQAKRDSSLTIACYNGRAEIVRILLDYKATIEHRNSNDYTPLCVSCLNGHHRVAQMLIQRGADINARGTKLGISPLMLAAMNGHTTIVKLLIESNADVNQCIETNRNTALTLACFQGRTECVRVLVEKGANLEWRSKNGLNAMMEAANGGFYEIGKILVEAGAEVDCAPVPSTKDTPLTIAAEKGHAKFVQLLIDNGASVNVRNKKGCTPLWLACQSGHFDCVRALVACGTADVDARDNRQMSCILTAFKRGHENIVKTLVDHIRCYPSEDEMTRYCREIKLNGNNAYLLSVYERCKKIILDAKHKKEAEADAKARSLLEELDLQAKTKEGQRAKKKAKKQKKKGKNDDDDNLSNARTYDSEPTSPVPSRDPSPVKNKLALLPVAPAEPDDDQDDDQTKEDPSKKRKKRKNRGKNKTGPDGDAAAVVPTVVPVLQTLQPAKPPDTIPMKKSFLSNGPAGKKNDTAKSPPGVRRPATAPAQPTQLADDEDVGDENEWLTPSPPGMDEWVQQRSKSQKSTTTGGSSSQISHSGQGESMRGDTRRTLTTNLRQEGWKEVVGRSKRFKVPTSAIARIIGKGGTNINAIRSSTCAHIEIEKNKPGINDRLITVKGTSEAVAEAYHIIQTLCDNPDRDLEELLRETKRDSVTITAATVSQPSGVPLLIKPVPMPLEIESRRLRAVVPPPPANPPPPPPTSHTTQVFTNSHMHRGPTENYSSIVSASQQKRSSIHSASSKDSGQEGASVQIPRISSSVTVDRETISPASASSSATSNRASPSGAKSGFSGMPSPAGVDYRPAAGLPTSRSQPLDSVGKETVKSKLTTAPVNAAGLLSVEEAKMTAPAPPPPSTQSTPSKPSVLPVSSAVSGPDRAGLLGALYNDLRTERHNWSPDPDLDFFAKEPVILQTTSPVSAASVIFQPLHPPRESRFLRNAFEAPTFGGTPSQASNQFGAFSPNRPASLPQDLRATDDYRLHGNFVSGGGGYPSNGLDAYGGISSFGHFNGDNTGSSKYRHTSPLQPTEPEPLWSGGSEFGGGYGDFSKEMEPEQFMSVAQTLVQFERDRDSGGQNYYQGGGGFGSSGGRRLMDFDGAGQDLSFGGDQRHSAFDESVAPVSRGSRLMKPAMDMNSGFGGMTTGFTGVGSTLNNYPSWDSSLFSAYGGLSTTSTDTSTFGALGDPLPNMTGLNRGSNMTSRLGNGSLNAKESPVKNGSTSQSSSGDRRNY